MMTLPFITSVCCVSYLITSILYRETLKIVPITIFYIIIMTILISIGIKTFKDDHR
jgi:uncharacterized membrane protein